MGGTIALENPSISSRASKIRFAIRDQTVKLMHEARASRTAFDTESDKEAVQDALPTGQG